MDNQTSLSKNDRPPYNQAELSLSASRQGWDAYASKDYAQSEEYFRSALAENPNDVDTYFGLGLALRYAGKHDQAILVFNQVLDLIDTIEDQNRAGMVRRLTLGHIHQIQLGDWNLEKEVWSKKR